MKPAKTLRLLMLVLIVGISSYLMYACNDAGDKPADSETPATSTDTLVPGDTLNPVTDTISVPDTTKGGQAPPPR